jgi:hypothetical protein
VTAPRHKRNAIRRSQATQQKALGTCPGCGKRAYTSKATAKAAARRLYPGGRIRAYSCPGTPWWHLTSQDAERTARMREHAVQTPAPAALPGDPASPIPQPGRATSPAPSARIADRAPGAGTT